MAAPQKPETAHLLASVLKALLRPLVKVLIANGVTVGAAYRLLKEVYVEVAEHDFAIPDKRPTDSRIHLLTGVHRKDVRAIRDAGYDTGDATRLKVATLSGLIGQWLADPDYVDAAGRPLVLPREAPAGISFEALARAQSTDVRPRTLLDELVAQGLVDVDAERGEVRLLADALVGPADLEQKVHFFAENVGDHIAAASENLLSHADPAPFLERAVFYNRLTPGSVDTLEASARALGSDALSTLNRLAFAMQKEDADKPDGVERFRFGLFFYRAREDGLQDEATPEPGGRDDDD